MSQYRYTDWRADRRDCALAGHVLVVESTAQPRFEEVAGLRQRLPRHDIQKWVFRQKYLSLFRVRSAGAVPFRSQCASATSPETTQETLCTFAASSILAVILIVLP